MIVSMLKLINFTEFIYNVGYVNWKGNTIDFPKKKGKVWVCIDYKNLIKAFPNDDYPLPIFEQLLDKLVAIKCSH